MSLFQITWPFVRTVLASGLPNILLLIVIAANFMWWSRLLPIYYIGVPFMTVSDVGLESVLTVGALVVADIIVISLFARRWRARRWARKPGELAAAKYFGQ